DTMVKYFECQIFNAHFDLGNNLLIGEIFVDQIFGLLFEEDCNKLAKAEFDSVLGQFNFM
ncbi:23517_t:CDS:2, partial [Gigaspora rosea]